MSPRAACRLERLGFTEVYDYTAGKSDWLAAGLSTVRSSEEVLRAVQVVIDVATCRLEDMTDALVAPAASAVPDVWAVVDDKGVVHGRLRAGRLTDSPAAHAEAVMEIGPTTVRADEPVAELRERMGRRSVDHVLVTTPEGRLLGAVTPAQP